MSRNGAGTYVLPAGQPVVTGTTISSTVHNTLATDLANALTTSIATDGQSVVTANIPFSGYKLTGVGAATVNGDALRFEDKTALIAAEQEQTYTAFTTGGTSTAYTLTPSPAITAYAVGQSFWVNFNAASGAAPTLTISGVATPPNLVKQIADGTYANIAANDIPINHRSRVTLISATQALVDLPAAAAKYIASLGNNTSTIYTTAGTSTAYTITPTPAITAYAAGQSFVVKFNAACGAAPTLEISGVGTPPNLVKANADGSVSNLVASDVPADHHSRITLISATQALVESMPRSAKILVVEERQAVGTNGGGSSAGVNARVLNTVVENSINGASLASNQITLPAGRYVINATAPAYAADFHKAYLYNITDAALQSPGSGEFVNTAIGVQTRSHIRDVFTISAAKVFALRHYVTTGVATTGLGRATNAAAAGVEVYASVTIEQVTP
jgi:hypothetical protein